MRGNRWPLTEQPKHFELGCILSCAVIDAIAPDSVGALAVRHAGLWECDLADNSLTWSGGVFDIFGLQRGTRVSREETIGFYSEHSRAAMERLRAHAIRHKCGFTLDAEIAPATGERRRMRLIGAAVCDPESGRVVRLHGLKLII
jgi:hypothetical protein